MPLEITSLAGLTLDLLWFLQKIVVFNYGFRTFWRYLNMTVVDASLKDRSPKVTRLYMSPIKAPLSTLHGSLKMCIHRIIQRLLSESGHPQTITRVRIDRVAKRHRDTYEPMTSILHRTRHIAFGITDPPYLGGSVSACEHRGP